MWNLQCCHENHLIVLPLPPLSATQIKSNVARSLALYYEAKDVIRESKWSTWTSKVMKLKE